MDRLDESSPSPAPVSRSPLVRRIQAILLVVVLLGLAAWFGLPWYRDRSYAGTTVTATLEWSCINAVFWTDSDRGVRWRSVPDWPSKSQLDALEGTASGGTYDMGPHRAVGTMQFANYTDATFVSRTGAELRFVRQPEGQFYEASCAIR